MPVKKGPGGKYRIGSGPAIYKTKKSAMKAYKGCLASGKCKEDKK